MKTSKNKKAAILFSCLFYISPFVDIVTANTFCVTDSVQLQNALQEAGKNKEFDIIMVAEGTYKGHFSYFSNNEYGISIRGRYNTNCTTRNINSSKTILQADGTGESALSLITNKPVDIEIDGLTLQNANTQWPGGGIIILTEKGKVTLSNSIIKNNRGSCGGVYIANAETVTIKNNSISGNHAFQSGGGVFIHKSDNVIMLNNVITSNYSKFAGGGAYISAKNEVIFGENKIQENEAGSSAGGVYVTGHTIFLNRNTIKNNLSKFLCGGIFVRSKEIVNPLNNDITENIIDGYFEIQYNSDIVLDLFVSGGRAYSPLTFSD